MVENAAFHRADEVGDDRIKVLMRMICTKHHFSDHIWEFEETPEIFWGLHDKQGEDDEVAENDESAQNDEEAPKNDEEDGSDEEFGTPRGSANRGSRARRERRGSRIVEWKKEAKGSLF